MKSRFVLIATTILVGIVHSHANDAALNDAALNDAALNDAALNDGALNDGADWLEARRREHHPNAI